MLFEGKQFSSLPWPLHIKTCEIDGLPDASAAELSIAIAVIYLGSGESLTNMGAMPWHD